MQMNYRGYALNTLTVRIRRLGTLSVLPLAFMPCAYGDIKYNTSFLYGDENASSLQAIAKDNGIMPGVWPVEIYLNTELVEEKKVEFRRTREHGVVACLTSSEYRDLGVRMPESDAKDNNDSCVVLEEKVEGAKTDYDPLLQRLSLSIPQVHLTQRVKGYVSPKLYDDGVTAAFSNYNLSANHYSYRGEYAGEADYLYGQLSNGINSGAWRVRNFGSFSKQPGQGLDYENASTYVERDIVSLTSRLKLGQGSTNNAVFDAVPFRGVQLSRALDMLPDSLSGFAPVVRGVARTNARVEVRQNGYLVYNTTVAPGSFALKDLFPARMAGDLDVTVIESDGSTQEFKVPYSAVPTMLREDQVDYQFTAGQYDNGMSSYKPGFIQGGISYGVSDDLTPFGGVMLSENYRSAVFGIGESLGVLGATSFDMAFSDTELASGEKLSGNSFRILYAKALAETGTNIRVAGYRYSSAGYFDFADSVAERNSFANGMYRNDYIDKENVDYFSPDWSQKKKSTFYTSEYRNKRQRLEATIDQQLPWGDAVYLTLASQNYWSTPNSDRTLQLGYNGTWKKVNVGLFLQDVASNYGYRDTSLNMNLSVPFDAFGEGHGTTARTAYTQSKRNGSSQMVGISGTGLEHNKLSYSMDTANNAGMGQSGSINASYLGSQGTVSGGYYQSSQVGQASFGLSGSLVAHSGGITAGQTVGDTFAIAEAKGARGVEIEGQPGTRIDRMGYALINAINPYHLNRIALNSADADASIDVKDPVRNVVPTRGAIVKATFETSVGMSLLIHTVLEDGGYPLPGAGIYDKSGKSAGTVGTNGEVFVSGVNPGDLLTVKWGESTNQMCSLTIPEYGVDAQATGYSELDLTCKQ